MPILLPVKLKFILALQVLAEILHGLTAQEVKEGENMSWHQNLTLKAHSFILKIMPEVAALLAHIGETMRSSR